MNTIQDFIKSKLKSNNLLINTFIHKCGVSRSTMYRVMKGYQPPSDALLEKIIKVLKLNTVEQQQLRYFCTLADADEDYVAARHAVRDLLINAKLGKGPVDPVELVYYDNDTYIRTFDKVLESMLAASSGDCFKCRIRMVNCCQEQIVRPLFLVLSDMFDRRLDYKVEHLVSFSTEHHEDNLSVLQEIIPLLPLDGYTVLYKESEETEAGGILSDFMMLDYSYKDSNGVEVVKHLYISFARDGLSSCYCASDGNLVDFFERNYRALHLGYKLALNKSKEFEFFGAMFAELEQHHNMYLFKSEPCYNRVPIPVYENMIERNTEAMILFMSGFLREPVTDETFADQVNELLEYIDTRINASTMHRQKDFFTCDGLRHFLDNGRFSDHLPGLPAFNRAEVAKIFRYIRKRSIDPNDTYEFYLLKEPYGYGELMLVVYDGYGIVVEYNTPRYKGVGNDPYCIIEHSGIGRLLADFSLNYVPNMLAMTKEDALAHLDDLIELAEDGACED